jgi:FkbM family methyltransferase
MLYESEIHDALTAMRFPLVYPLSFLHHARPDVFPTPEYDETFSALFRPENQAAIIALAEQWGDETSLATFYGLIRFRLTLDKKNIRDVRSSYPQYFDPGLISLNNDEVFLDCGAYTGDTMTQFVHATSGIYKKVYAFEPDRTNFIALSGRAAEVDPSRIVPLNLGICDSSGTRSFNESGTIDTRMGGDKGAVLLPVVSIDDFMRTREPATFIKMDIEGGEMGALAGARETIQRQKPKLAISVYHKACDLWQIPVLIKQLNSGYRIYLRHYTNEPVDTVCYAI